MPTVKHLSRAAVASAMLLYGMVASTNPGEPVAVEHISGGRKATAGDTLQIATLNLAHGRGSALNQLLVSEQKTRHNLARVAKFMREKDIHIAALQEADAPSWWSGSFDHTFLIADLAGFSWHASSPHANLGIGRYGTAIVSVLPMANATRHDFPPTPPTARKGFTAAEIRWPVNDTEARLDVISIHMDFSRTSVRQIQLAELRSALANRSNPLAVMGDFNSVEIAQQLMREESSTGRHLHTAGDHGEPWHTYQGKRLDWILLSDELEFLDYNTYPDTLSDHRLVAASIRLKTPAGHQEEQ